MGRANKPLLLTLLMLNVWQKDKRYSLTCCYPMVFLDKIGGLLRKYLTLKIEDSQGRAGFGFAG